MEEFKGTKGPWFVDQEGGADVWVTDSDNCRAVARVTNYMMNGSQINNANLIAAAPELLDALQDLLIRTSDVDEFGDDYIFAKARATIAKALGK